MTVAPVAPVGPALSPIDAMASQPLAERIGFSDTALTVPGGHVDVSARAWLGATTSVRIALGLGSRAEVWVEGSDGALSAYALGARFVLAHGDRFQLTVDGWVRDVERDVTDDAFTSVPAFQPLLDADAASLGITGSVCFDIGCHVLFSMGVRGAFADPLSSSPSTFANNEYGTVSLSAGNARWRGVFETLVTPNSDGTYGSMVVAAARYTRGSFAAELGALIGTDDQDRTFTPLLGVAWRP